MQLNNTFTVSIPVAQAWSTLLDFERVAPCLPGAVITDVDGDGYHGGVKIKIGPVTAQYHGVATYVEADESTYRAVISAKGKDIGGQGNAEARIVATLSPYGAGTRVQVDTDLDLSGRVAQFGRGVITDVTGKLLTQFSKNLEAEINAGSRASEEYALGTSAAARDAVPRPHPSPNDVQPLDVTGGIGGYFAKYALPALGAVAVLAVGVLLGRRGRNRARAPSAPVNVNLTLPAERFVGGGA